MWLRSHITGSQKLDYIERMQERQTPAQVSKELKRTKRDF